MAYVVYNTQNAKIRSSHTTMRGAKIALAAAAKRTNSKMAVTDRETYNREVNTDVQVTNLMSGKPMTIKRGTPLCCDPSSETYWSM